MKLATCDQAVRLHLDALGRRFSCYEEDERLWTISPYEYPDSDRLEVAIRLLGDDQAVVSDVGETLRRLADFAYDPRDTPKGRYLLDEIAKQHNVTLQRGVVAKRVSLSEVGDALNDVLAACLAIAHLAYLSRAYRPATFVEEVAQFLTEHGLPFTPKHEEQGLTGKLYAIDFRLPRPRSDALLQAIPSAKSTARINATFRLWSDVRNSRLRVSILDDTQDEPRAEDLALLGTVSEVFTWSGRSERLLERLASG